MMKTCLWMFLLFQMASTEAWVSTFPISRSCCSLAPLPLGGIQMMANRRDDDGADGDGLPQQSSEARREQEMIMEELSLKGADRIAKMGIPERAKRAMLAEAVEDRIFELTDSLEDMVEDDGSVALENREKAVELASQTKNLQQQYDDLVTGKPSSVLTALETMGRGSSDS